MQIKRGRLSMSVSVWFLDFCLHYNSEAQETLMLTCHISVLRNWQQGFSRWKRKMKFCASP